jgi:hypothetical protein
MDRIYAPDAWFKDPFNEVRGVRDISRIFAHMFEQVDAPRFVVTEALVQGSSVMLTWDFNFSFKNISLWFWFRSPHTIKVHDFMELQDL